ncbi:hypothetical protein [Saccharothrix sp. ST-888]|nr:hypothetical protein [Saccharothrix sp. ST-888]
MNAYDERLGRDIDAWVEDQLATSPEWAPEQYVSIRQQLEGSTPAAGADD